MWRWFPIGDRFVDLWSSRDTDSMIHQREVDAVDAWLQSDKLVHIMRGIYCENNLCFSVFKSDSFPNFKTIKPMEHTY